MREREDRWSGYGEEEIWDWESGRKNVLEVGEKEHVWSPERCLGREQSP